MENLSLFVIFCHILQKKETETKNPVRADSVSGGTGARQERRRISFFSREIMRFSSREI